MKQFTPTYTSCPWPSHLKVGRDRSGGRFLIFLERILLADQVNALPIWRIKLNKNKSIGRTKVQVQSFHTSLSVNSSGQRNFNREPRLGFFFFLLFFTPLETHYAKTRMPDVSDRHCTTVTLARLSFEQWDVRDGVSVMHNETHAIRAQVAVGARGPGRVRGQERMPFNPN